jgi:hypothetical protein
MSPNAQIGIAQPGIAQIGLAGETDGLSVYDAITGTESVSVSVIGDPAYLEASVFDAVTLAESSALTFGADLSVFDAITATESTTITVTGRSRSALLLLGVG